MNERFCGASDRETAVFFYSSFVFFGLVGWRILKNIRQQMSDSTDKVIQDSK